MRLGLAALSLAVLAGAACWMNAPADPPVIGPEVAEMLRRDGLVHVLVSLRISDPPVEPEALAAVVATHQDSVLRDLQAHDYRNRQRYRSVPALAGTILTGRGLDVLAAHPAVRRVDVDRGGGGT